MDGGGPQLSLYQVWMPAAEVQQMADEVWVECNRKMLFNGAKKAINQRICAGASSRERVADKTLIAGDIG